MGSRLESDRLNYRVIEIAKVGPENPEILDRFANPEELWHVALNKYH